jgi:hypothetical protein
MNQKQFALCVTNQLGNTFSGDDLIPGWAYEVLSEEQGCLRIIDESGEDYLYPASAFMLVDAQHALVLENSYRRMA